MSYFIHKSRGGGDDGRAEERESDRRGEERREKKRKACRSSLFWLQDRACPVGGAVPDTPNDVRHQLSGESGILGHGEESHSLNVRQV